MGFGLKASNKGGDYSEVPPAGTHPAVVVAIIDLGTHQEEYQGKVNMARKVLFVFELTTEVKSDGARFIVARDFTLTSGKKSNLRGMLEKWRGKAYEDGEDMPIDKLLGKPCLVSVTHGKSASTGNEYAKIDSVSAPIKGMQMPPAENKPLLYEIEGGGEPPDLDWLPYLYGQKVAEKIKSSEEWKKKLGQQYQQRQAAGQAGNGTQQPAQRPAAAHVPATAAMADTESIPF